MPNLFVGAYNASIAREIGSKVVSAWMPGKYPPNDEQQAVINWAMHDIGNGTVSALPGTGKTSLIILLLPHICSDPSDVTSSTMHAAGFRAWKNANKYKTIKVDGNKLSIMMDEMSRDEPLYKEQFSYIRKITSFAKLNGFGCAGFSAVEDVDAWSEMSEYYMLEDEIKNGCDPGRLIPLAQYLYTASIAQGDKLIDFDDQLLLPLFHKCKLPTYDWVIVDELQDLSRVRQELALRMMHKTSRFLGVGDPNQCQPGGTMVTLQGGHDTTMDSLKVGDVLVTYNREEGAFVGRQSQGRRVNKIAKRKYSGRMLAVSTPNNSTDCTPNHKWLVRWKRGTGKNVVYLMKKGDKYRVGWCQLFNSTRTNHLAQRSRIERADATWILSVHDSKAEASLQECKVAVQFGIPQVMFQQASGQVSHYTQKVLNDFWSWAGDLTGKAAVVLAHFGREAQYPHWNGGHKRLGRTTISEVQACNLLPEVMELPLYTGGKLIKWSKFEVDSYPYDGTVYSLDVADHHNYVADGILTCNSIYGFTGADCESMDRMTQMTNAKVFPLTLTYRCPQIVVEMVKQYIPAYRAHESNPVGEYKCCTLLPTAQPAPLLGGTPTATVADEGQAGMAGTTTTTTPSFWEFAPFTADDAVICRKNKPLVELCYTFLRKRIPARIEGREIGGGLIKLCTKWKVTQLEALEERLENYREREMEKFRAKKQDGRADDISDKVDTIMTLIDATRDEGGRSVSDLTGLIGRMFGDTPEGQKPACIVLSSVHKFKGREAKRVFILGRNAFMPSKLARTEQEKRQERNLIVVAMTRPLYTLVDVQVPADAGKKGRK